MGEKSTQTPTLEESVQGLSLDELVGMRPDLQIVDPAPVAEAREALEVAIDGMQIGDAAKAALKGTARESVDSVAAMLNGFLAQVGAMGDLDAGAKESVTEQVTTIAEKLGARVFLSMADAGGNGDGDEGDDEGDDADGDKGDEGGDGDDDDKSGEADVDESVQEALASRDAFDEALEGINGNDELRGLVRDELKPKITSGELRGVEAVKGAVTALAEKYTRAVEAIAPKGAPRFDGVTPTGGDRATESTDTPAPSSRFYPSPVSKGETP